MLTFDAFVTSERYNNIPFRRLPEAGEVVLEDEHRGPALAAARRGQGLREQQRRQRRQQRLLRRQIDESKPASSELPVLYRA